MNMFVCDKNSNAQIKINIQKSYILKRKMTNILSKEHREFLPEYMPKKLILFGTVGGNRNRVSS